MKTIQIPKGTLAQQEQQPKSVSDKPAISDKTHPGNLKKGMVIDLQGSVYKVIAARPNGKVTIKYMGPRQPRQQQSRR